MTAESDVQERLALLLEEACGQFELASALAAREFIVTAPNGTIKDQLLCRANSTAMMALAKGFLFNARRAFRLIEHNNGKLNLDRAVRNSFRNAMTPIVDVRDVIEHGSDENGLKGKTPIRPRQHIHDDGEISVDETSIVFTGDKMLMGPLDLFDIYKEVHKMKEIAGFASLPSDF
jgi:hypothetical protein